MSDERQVVVVLVSHGGAALALVEAAERVVGKIPDLRTVAVESGEQGDVTRRLILDTVADVDDGNVLFVVDVFGSTPCRLCTETCSTRGVVLTGLNLPMLFKLATADRSAGAHALAQQLASTAAKSIQVIGGGEVALARGGT